MFNVDEFNAEMARNRYTRTKLAKEMGMSSKTLYNKIKKGVFGSDEIDKIVSLLHINDPRTIFFVR